MLIIHGENQTASRQYFISLLQSAKQKDLQVIQLAGSDLTMPTLTTAAESVSLFGQTNSIFIDDFFSRRPSNEKKLLIEYLSSHPGADITLWESKDVTSQLKSFPPSSTKIFPLPKFIFDFLDTLSVELFQKTVQTMPAEQIFASIVTRIHKVIIGEGRIKKQLSTDRLVSAYQELLKIDYAQKTSSSPHDLAAALEVWLVKL